jgi:hypothetical protein
MAGEDWLTQAMTTALTPAELDQLAASVKLLKRLAQA